MTDQVLHPFQSALQLTYIYETAERNCQTKTPWTEPFQEIERVSVFLVSDKRATVMYFYSNKTEDKET